MHCPIRAQWSDARITSHPYGQSNVIVITTFFHGCFWPVTGQNNNMSTEWYSYSSLLGNLYSIVLRYQNLSSYSHLNLIVGPLWTFVHVSMSIPLYFRVLSILWNFAVLKLYCAWYHFARKKLHSVFSVGELWNFPVNCILASWKLPFSLES